ncbi:hypothetical protein SAMN06264364_12041 [Quadrisphaera granulorum]|uniref:Uncharacterized protein n=1 Tax=Quadrisphaera granulorum TaxID=317664 RepID=A0A316A2E5_9ACTN|nr:hypothetical protein [Quadrisphaera granulorum]PWJ51763.1 hypothetical protein BXY45_12041 [Quadrisphaera granulorum]SZE97710.1 hypothetical protein SAMN06264364_12041 [Quadrisphaera granulorum]
MDVLPLLLVVLAAFVVIRLVQLALVPSARQNAASAAAVQRLERRGQAAR